jgi:hypothetical protein
MPERPEAGWRSTMNERFEYTINRDDVITHVNDDWKAFAEENSGEGLGDRVVGTWLWQHLAGVEVKHLFKALVERVREEGSTVKVPFRCDAPELRRFMVLELTSLPDGGIQFSSWIEREEDREPMSLLVPDREADPDLMVKMCAWCKRIHAAPDRWRELEDALGELGLFHLERLPRITHGVCKECQARVMRDMETQAS